MKTLRHSMVSTSSQKTLTEITKDSHEQNSSGLYGQNQKRFTRKNNTSHEKNKNRSKTDNGLDISDLSLMSDTSKTSQSKCLGANRLTDNFRSNSRISQDFASRTSSFKIIRTSEIPQIFQKTNPYATSRESLRISEQKNGSRDGCSVDSFKGKRVSNNNLAVLKTELELKQHQVASLQDQRRKLRKQIEQMKIKQDMLEQKLHESQLVQKQNRIKFQENVKDLEKKLQQYISYNDNLQQQNQYLKKSFQELSKEKEIIQKQLQLFINKKVPKNILELQSYREISLSLTIQELKNKISLNKTDIEKCMEETIIQLQKQNLALSSEVKRLEIVSRLQQKKTHDAQRYLEAYSAIKGDYKLIQRQLKSLQDECELLRLENTRLKKQSKKQNVCDLAKSTSKLKPYIRYSTVKSNMNDDNQVNLLEQSYCSDNSSLNLSF